MENSLRLFAIYNNGIFCDLTTDFFSVYCSHLQRYAGSQVPTLKVLEGPLFTRNESSGVLVRVLDERCSSRLPDVDVQTVYYAYKNNFISDTLFLCEELALKFLTNNSNYKMATYVVSRWSQYFTIRLIKTETLEWFTETFPQTGKDPIRYIGYKNDSQPAKPVQMPNESSLDFDARVEKLNVCRKEEAEYPEKMRKLSEEANADRVRRLNEMLERHNTMMDNLHRDEDDECEGKEKEENPADINNQPRECKSGTKSDSHWGKPGTELRESITFDKKETVVDMKQFLQGS